MLSVITEIDGAHAVVVWNDLFHGERVDRIPLVVRWRQDCPIKELQEWQYLQMPIDGHLTLTPASHIHPLVVFYSRDQGQTWCNASFSAIRLELPVLRFVIPELPPSEVSTDTLSLIVPTDVGPVCFSTPHPISIVPRSQYEGELNIEPIMSFFLHAAKITEALSRKEGGCFHMEMIEEAKFHRVPIRSANLAVKYKPSMFAAVTQPQDAI